MRGGARPPRVSGAPEASLQPDPALSVLMPVRDGERTVRAALRSTLRALRERDQVLVLDDASRDSTWRVLQSVAASDARVRLLREPVNRGVAASLNLLLAAAGTELVARMDADDLVLPWRFELQRRAVGRSCDVVFSTVVHRQEGRRTFVPQVPSRIGPAAVPASLLLGNALAHPTMLARRQVLVDVGGYRPVPSEDYDLWIRLALAGRTMRRLAVPGIVYRRSDRQVTASARWKAEAVDNRLTADVHAQLLRRELRWERPGTFAVLRSEPRREHDEVVRSLLTSVRERVRDDPSARSFALRRQLRAAGRGLGAA